MSTRLIATVAAVAACGIATAATRAQAPSPTTLTATVVVTPQKAGTARRPAGVKLDGKAELATPEGVAWPAVTGFEIWYGPGIVFNGDRFPACRKTELRHGGPGRCPPTSIMGTGTLSDGLDRPMDFGQGGQMTFINATGGRIVAWMVLKNPARVAAAVFGDVIDGAPGRWPHRESFTIPSSLRIVAGIPIALRGFTFAIGGKSYAKRYFASTDCPKGGWAWKVHVHTRSGAGAANVLETHGRAPCHR